jgi:uncharacterized Rossmann fold enzyme
MGEAVDREREEGEDVIRQGGGGGQAHSHVSPKQSNKNKVLEANEDVLSVGEEGVALQIIVGDEDHDHRELRAEDEPNKRKGAVDDLTIEGEETNAIHFLCRDN